MKLGDLSKPLGQRRPKIMERRPDHPPPTSFEIDDRKLHSATQPTDKWLETPAGRVFLWIGFFLLALIALAAVVGLVMLMVAFPGFAVGIGIFVLVTVAGVLFGRPASSRR